MLVHTAMCNKTLPPLTQLQKTPLNLQILKHAVALIQNEYICFLIEC